MKAAVNFKSTMLLASVSFALVSCGGGDTEIDTDQMVADMMAEANANAMTFDDGYDSCFKAVASLLGNDAKVSEIRTLFSAGNEIDSMQMQPRGQMTSCEVQYQNPDNPKKMLSARFDNKTGEFSEPREMEITVIGGNASEFSVDDYVMPLSDVNYAALGAFMEGKQEALGGAYSDFAWTGFTLNAPGLTQQNHTLGISLVGRLASNDVKESGSASFQTDGTTVIRDGLLPR
ncbi:MAG: hypothetical protein AAFQ27_07960 [Pseudomonadota bacterium]